MTNSNGKLEQACIVRVENDGITEISNKVIRCQFNPYEYTLTKSNSFEEKKSAKGKNSPDAELSKAGAQTLQLSLVFDSYHDQGPNDGKYRDVSLVTDELWDLMRVNNNEAGTESSKPGKNQKPPVPLVAFKWGVFFFVSYITSMTQKFTLFASDGVPVRAKVDVTFTQYVDRTDRKQNPSSGGGPINRMHRVVAGDRLDLIAHTVYHDATKWRHIAAFNNIVDPQSLRPGQVLAIPFLEE